LRLRGVKRSLDATAKKRGDYDLSTRRDLIQSSKKKSEVRT